MKTCEKFPTYDHAHYEPCPSCGDIHRDLVSVPGRAIGGGWVAGASAEQCNTCNKLLAYRGRT